MMSVLSDDVCAIRLKHLTLRDVDFPNWEVIQSFRQLQSLHLHFGAVARALPQGLTTDMLNPQSLYTLDRGSYILL